MDSNNNISSLGIEKYITSVEVAFKNREEYVFHITISKKQKGKLILILQKQGIDFNECKSILKKTGDFMLLITGKPVVHKKLSRFYDNEIELISAMVPDAKASDFSAQSWEYNGQFFGTLIRSDLLEKIGQQFSSVRLFPEQLIIGSYTTLVLPTILEKEDFGIDSYNTHFFFTNGVLESIKAIDPVLSQPVQIGSDSIMNENIPGFCTNINHSLAFITHSNTTHPISHHLLDENKHKKRFKTILYTSAAVLFLLVMINYMYNQHLSSRHMQLEEELAVNQQALNEIEKLETEIAEKKSLVGKRYSSNGPVIGHLADELASIVPKEVRLTNMEVFPLTQKLQKEKPVFFSFNKIAIDGVCTQSETLDNWIQTCKKFKWVKDVSLIKYQFDNEQKKGVFKIELLL